MRPVRCHAVVLLTAAAAAGCSSPGKLIARHVDGVTEGAVGRAPTDGTYCLFIAGSAEPLFPFPLKAGQPLGFEVEPERAADGMPIRWLFAVAGGERRRVDLNHTYEWRRP